MPTLNQLHLFRVLLDEPSEKPVLGFDTYAKALSDLILKSKPQFTIGVFGEWGSGKTTLLKAIERQLKWRGRKTVIRVEFNAWRYEREEHLVVPLLDTLREALAQWAKAHAENGEPAPDSAAGLARRAAATVGRASRALLAGLSITGRVPLLTEASLDFDKVMAHFDAGSDQQAAEQALSFYHQSFATMKNAIAPFVEGGRRRIVVFVDDLDRCLPENALQVLESMKLLFDQLGFVFVVGLDKTIIARSIELKYHGHGRDENANPGISGAEYVKKIFQVPYTLPRVGTGQLDEYFDALVDRTGLHAAQQRHFRDTVRPHLPFIVGEAKVNPREIKRLLNAYVLQLKMLAPKFESSHLTFEPQVVLALQAMGFRADWEHLYEALVTDPALFVNHMRQAVDGNDPEAGGGLWLGDEETPVPYSFLAYLRDRGHKLLRQDLDVYVTSLESSRSTDSGVVEMQRSLGRLRGLVRQIASAGEAPVTSEAQSDLIAQVEHLQRMVGSESSSAQEGRELVQVLNDLKELLHRQEPEKPRSSVALAQALSPYLSRLGVLLLELRRRSTVGATA